MFTVKWVARGQETTAIEVERYAVHNPDVVVETCRMRLAGVQRANPKLMIDGFVVLDSDDKIIRDGITPKK